MGSPATPFRLHKQRKTHMKDKRKMAVERIRRKMESDHSIDPAPTFDDILKKIHNRRTYFNAERNKEEASKSTEQGADNVYQSSWQFYGQLAFLNDNVAPRTHSNTFQPPKDGSNRRRSAALEEIPNQRILS